MDFQPLRTARTSGPPLSHQSVELCSCSLNGLRHRCGLNLNTKLSRSFHVVSQPVPAPCARACGRVGWGCPPPQRVSWSSLLSWGGYCGEVLDGEGPSVASGLSAAVPFSCEVGSGPPRRLPSGSRPEPVRQRAERSLGRREHRRGGRGADGQPRPQQPAETLAPLSCERLSSRGMGNWARLAGSEPASLGPCLQLCLHS